MQFSVSGPKPLTSRSLTICMIGLRTISRDGPSAGRHEAQHRRVHRLLRVQLSPRREAVGLGAGLPTAADGMGARLRNRSRCRLPGLVLREHAIRQVRADDRSRQRGECPRRRKDHCEARVRRRLLRHARRDLCRADVRRAESKPEPWLRLRVRHFAFAASKPWSSSRSHSSSSGQSIAHVPKSDRCR